MMTNRSQHQRSLASRLYDEAVRTYDLHQFAEAGRLLGQVLDLAPDFDAARKRIALVERQLQYEAHYRNGRRLARAGRHSEAIRAFRQIGGDSPYYPASQHWARVSRREQVNERRRAAHVPTVLVTRARIRAVKYATPVLAAIFCGIMSAALMMSPAGSSGAGDLAKTAPMTSPVTSGPGEFVPTATPVQERSDEEAPVDTESDNSTSNDAGTPAPGPSAKTPAAPGVTVTPGTVPNRIASPTARSVAGGSTGTRVARADPSSTPTARPPTNTPAPTRTPTTVTQPAEPTRISQPPTATPTAPTATPTRPAQPSATAPSISIASTASAATATSTAASSTVPMTVHADAYLFSPDTITLPAGTRVRLTLVNDGDTTYNWVLLGANTVPIIRIAALPGRSSTAEFTLPSTPGTYTVLCDIDIYAALGMKGTLIVTAR